MLKVFNKLENNNNNLAAKLFKKKYDNYDIKNLILKISLFSMTQNHWLGS